MSGVFSGILIVLWVAYWIGFLVAIIALPYRIGSSPSGAYVTAFAHPASRRNGIPWVARTLGKALGWPVVFGMWMNAGRPPTPELFGPDAAEALGMPPGSANAFATRWTRSA